MKAPFRISTNVFLRGLKLLGQRNRHMSYLFSANLDLSSPSSPADATVVIDGTSAESLRKRNNVQLLGGKHVVGHGSNINYQKHKDGEMELVKSILAKHGWNIYNFDVDIASLNEMIVVEALNYVFHESASAALALHFFRWLEGRWNHTIKSVCSMVYILICGNMNHRAVDLLSGLVREGFCKEAGFDLLLNALVEICTRAALETSSSMLVKCYIVENKLSVALNLVSGMEHHDIYPSKDVCSMLLKSLLRSGKEEVAWDFMEKLHRRGMVNSLVFTLFIDYYCRKGNVRCGWKLLIEMKKYGVKPDVVSYTIVVDFLCKRSCLREASSILFKMVGMGIPPDLVLLSSIIDGYCKAEMAEEALRIVNIFNILPNIYVYNSFLTKFCKDGDMVGAANVFQELLRLGLEADCFSYTTMIRGYCKTSDAMNAHRVLCKMLKRGIELSVNTYTVLIRSYCENGDIKEAECVFQTMKDEGLMPDIFVYNTMIDGYGKKGYLHKAFKLLDMMRSLSISPDTVTYNSIIHSLVISGYVKEAKYMLDELIKRGFPIDTISFTNVISGFSNKGQFEEAFLVWSYMSESHVKPDVVTCSAILNGYCRARHMNEACSLFSKMLDAGLIPDLILYNTMIHGFCSVGDTNKACCLISMMVEKNTMPNNVTCDALARGYEKSKVQSPKKRAILKLQQILLDHGLHVDISSITFRMNKWVN